MTEALIVTLPIALGGSFISYILYKVVHKYDKLESRKTKRKLYKSRGKQLKIFCSKETAAILKAKIH